MVGCHKGLQFYRVLKFREIFCIIRALATYGVYRLYNGMLIIPCTQGPCCTWFNGTCINYHIFNMLQV